MHTDFAYLLFSHLKRQPHPDRVNKIITQAVAIEQEFLTGKSAFLCHIKLLTGTVPPDALPVALIGMNVELLYQYIVCHRSPPCGPRLSEALQLGESFQLHGYYMIYCFRGRQTFSRSMYPTTRRLM
jgi:hypothetical protein